MEPVYLTLKKQNGNLIKKARLYSSTPTDVEKIHDDLPDTKWTSQIPCKLDQTKRIYIDADLANVENLAGSRIDFGIDDPVFGYKIEVSKDAKNWVVVVDHTSQKVLGGESVSSSATAIRQINQFCTLPKLSKSPGVS